MTSLKMQSVLDYFDALRKPGKTQHACFKLVKHLEKSQQLCPEGENLSTEMNYALKRLIRGLGSADQNTVVGFSTCLVSLLKLHSNLIQWSKIQEYVESELELKSSLLRGEEGMVSFGRVLVYGCVIRSGAIFEKLSNQDKSFLLDQLLLFCYRRSYISAPVYYYTEQFLKLVKFDKKYVKIVLSHILNNKFHMNIDMLHLLLSLQSVADLSSLLTSKNKFSIATSIPNLQQTDTLPDFVNIIIDIRSSEDLNRNVFARFASCVLGSPRLASALWSHVETKALAASSDLTVLKKLAIFKLFCSLVLHCESTQQVLAFLTPNLLECGVHSASDIPPDLVPSVSPMVVLSAKFTNRVVLRTRSGRLGYEGLECGGSSERGKPAADANSRSGVASDEESDAGLSDDEVADGFHVDPAHVFVMIQRFLTPRLMNVEKLTHTKILQTLVNSLDRAHVPKLAALYKDILASDKQTNTTTSRKKQNGRPSSGPEGPKSGFNNKDRIYVLNLLSKLVFHPSLGECRARHNEDNASDAWRYEQVRYVFDLALGVSPWNHEVASAYKKSLFSLLGHNLHHEILGRLVQHADLMIQNGQTKNVKLTPETVSCWSQSRDMLAKLSAQISACKSKPNDSSKRSILIAFQTMYLQLCLYLFLDDSISIDVIDELNHCYERFDVRKSSRTEDGSEPHWIEVITELLLSLLSKDSVLLRHLVSKVFKLLVPALNVQAVQQILQVLDPSKNPLKGKLEDSDDDEEEEQEEDEGEGEEDDSEDREDSEEEESELDEEYLGNETNTDKLRQAVNQALGMNGNITDAESIDLSDMDGSEAAALDSALAAAFSAVKRPHSSTSGRRPSKFAARAETRLVSFRVRVLDLVDSLATSSAVTSSAVTSSAVTAGHGHVTLDILATLFPLLRYTLSLPSQKALETRVRGVLAHVTSSKRGALFSGEDVSEQLLTDVLLNSVLEKGDTSLSTVQTISGEISSAILFLVRAHSASQKSQSYQDLAGSKFVECLLNSLESNFTKRNSIVPGQLFKSLFSLAWLGNVHCLASLPSHAFNPRLRYYNRSTALAYLAALLRNKHFLSAVQRAHSSYAAALQASAGQVVEKTVQFLSDPGLVSTAIASYTKNLCDVILALKTSPDLVPASKLDQLRPALTQLTVPCPNLARLYSAFDVKKVAGVRKKMSSSVANGDTDDDNAVLEHEDTSDGESHESSEEEEEPATKKKKKHRTSKTRKKNKLLRLADLSKGIEDVGGFGRLPVDCIQAREGASSSDEGASSSNEGATKVKSGADAKRKMKGDARTIMEVDDSNEEVVVNGSGRESRKERRRKARESVEKGRNGLASSSEEEDGDARVNGSQEERIVKRGSQEERIVKRAFKKRKADSVAQGGTTSGGSKKLKINGH